MEKPSFKKTSAAKLDERLEEFFIRQLGYSAPIKNDPDEKPGDPHYWRMVYPLAIQDLSPWLTKPTCQR
jgi:hypothetical protein